MLISLTFLLLSTSFHRCLEKVIIESSTSPTNVIELRQKHKSSSKGTDREGPFWRSSITDTPNQSRVTQPLKKAGVDCLCLPPQCLFSLVVPRFPVAGWWMRLCTQLTYTTYFARWVSSGPIPDLLYCTDCTKVHASMRAGWGRMTSSVAL